jgi:hypothetical protein
LEEKTRKMVEIKTIKVKELIEELKKMNPELKCVYAIDDEGNAFRQIWNLPTLGKLEGEDFISNDDEEYENTDGEEVVCIN